MKKRIWVLLLLALTLGLVFSLGACNLFGNGGGNEQTAPEYKGVTVSSTINAGTDTFIYAEQYQLVYITILLDNPDNVVIASVTLNDKVYEASEFESGSDRKNITIKVNVLDATGIVTYTVDAIKYVDGKNLKDVVINGDKTVKVGVYEENQVYATVTQTVGFNEITLNVTVKDDNGLIAHSNGTVTVELHSDDTLIDSKSLAVGDNTVTFDGLAMGEYYWYQVSATYDDFHDGQGVCEHLLANDIVRTNRVVEFDNVNVTYDGINFNFNWHEDAVGYSIKELHLIDGDNDTKLDSAATSVGNLLSGRAYAIVAYYDHNGSTENIRYDFHTLEKHTPTFEVFNLYVMETLIRVDLNIVDDDHAGSLEVKINGEKVTVSNQQQISFSDLTYGNTYEIELTYKYDLNDGAGEHTIDKPLTVTIDSQTIHQTSCKLAYVVLDDGTCAVSKNSKCIHTEIDIPSSIDGYVVTVINNFSDSANLTSVTIPDTVTAFSTYAFSDCAKLTSITIPQNVTTISGGLFSGCVKLETVTFDGNKVTSIEFNAFDGCVRFAEFTIPAGVTSIGNEAFSNCGNLGNVELPSGLETIGNSAFENCVNITELIVPSSVVSIGNKAFRGTKLQTLTFGADSKLTTIGDEAFYYQTELTTLALPSGLKTIGDRAFYNLNYLEALTIPSSVVTIGEQAFYSCCYKLQEIIFEGNNLTTICAGAFENCWNLTSVTIPSSVTTIGDKAFSNCSALQNVEFASNSKLQTIGNEAFVSCGNVQNITIPNSVVSIGYRAFASTKLQTITFEPDSHLQTIGEAAFIFNYATSIVIPASVVSIGKQAFYISNNLVNLTFAPNSHLETIGESAFQNCTEIESLVIPASVTTIGAEAFKYCAGLTSVIFDENSQLTVICDNAFTGCRRLPNITIPSSVVTIGHGAFGACVELKEVTFESGSNLETIGDSAFYTLRNITEVVIPASVTTIGEYAFSYCTGLETLTFEPNSKLNEIEQYAFYGCSNLTNLVIPASVTRIHIAVFQNCSKLQSVKFEEGSKLNRLGASSFTNCEKLTNIILPDGLVAIDGNVFNGCYELKWVVVPSTVTSIDTGAFYLMYNTKAIYATVYYCGSYPQWLTITFGTTDSDYFKYDKDADVYFFVGGSGRPTWHWDNGNPVADA